MRTEIAGAETSVSGSAVKGEVDVAKTVALLVACLVGLLLLLGCNGSGGLLSASTWTVKFPNQEGAGALDDLHVEWDRNVTVSKNQITPDGSFPNVAPPGGGTTTTDFTGATVQEGGSCFVTLDYAWEGDDHPNVKKWWWTDGGLKVGSGHEGNP